MKKNVFDSLFSYRPRPDRNLLEDYFTELLGFLFNFDKKLASEWIKELWDDISVPNTDDIRIFTQYPLGKYGRADLALIWTENHSNKSLLIENKIVSSLGVRGVDEQGKVKTQVDNYLLYQSEQGRPEDHKVCVFKMTSEKIYSRSSPHFLREFLWDRLYKFLRKTVENTSGSNNNPETIFLCDQIREFMRRHDMVFENFTVHDLASLAPYGEFRVKRDQLTEKIYATFKERSGIFKGILEHSYKATGADIVGKHYGIIFHNEEDCAYDSSAWVHIGLGRYLEEEWFAPIILRTQRIPDVQTMIGLWPESKDIQAVKRTYGNILEKLNDYLTRSTGSEARFETKEANKYICFYLRRPLSDFLKYDDQESEIMRFLRSGFMAVSNLVEDGTLSKMVNDKYFK